MNNKSDKLSKKTIRDRQKRIRPGECQKYIRVVIDSNIVSAPYGSNILSELNDAGVKNDVRSLPIKHSIVWERNMGQLALELTEVNALSGLWQKENHILHILTNAELLQIIETETIHRVADNFRSHYANMHHIVLFMQVNQKQSPAVSAALMELQIMYDIKVLQIEYSTKELASQIKRLTKAIAELPFKNQKSEVLSTFKKFLANDKKQCVRVEGTHGFGRLWQQHLNRLPLVTLEVAESIIDKYSCPKQLLEDLNNDADAVKVISDLKIKRSGPIALQTDRRIGNVLSSKICKLYNSRDPTTLI